MPDVVASVFNPSTGKAEAGRPLWIWGQPSHLGCAKPVQATHWDPVSNWLITQLIYLYSTKFY